MSVLVIAEAGVNHNGSLECAKEMVDIAKESGADFVKFQTFNADLLVLKDATKAEYQITGKDDLETQYELLKRLELSEDMHWEIKRYCDLRDITFISTAFDIKSVKFLRQMGQNLFKIPSGEVTNLPYLRFIGSMGCKIIMSTGMCDLRDVNLALDALTSGGTKHSDITLMHCTSQYPAPFSELNLSCIKTLASEFGTNVGYSDHTLGIEASIAAVAIGANVIEKHFTLSRLMNGPDHSASLEPKELKAMISAIRNIDLAMGNGVKIATECEIKNRDCVRKSIVAASLINEGELFTEDNLTTKRPGDGISPMCWDLIIGRRANQRYLKDQQILL